MIITKDMIEHLLHIITTPFIKTMHRFLLSPQFGCVRLHKNTLVSFLLTYTQNPAGMLGSYG